MVTVGEVRKGVALAPPAKRTAIERSIEIFIPIWFAGRILPVTRAIAERWGDLDGERQLAGFPLGVGDGLIAATALAHGLTEVTRNVKDFVGLGATLLNPWETG